MIILSDFGLSVKISGIGYTAGHIFFKLTKKMAIALYWSNRGKSVGQDK